jgi:hypothetical protein
MSGGHLARVCRLRVALPEAGERFLPGLELP